MYMFLYFRRSQADANIEEFISLTKLHMAIRIMQGAVGIIQLIVRGKKEKRMSSFNKDRMQD